MPDFVFPEDTGTGAAGGDNVDAANFATLAFRGEHRNRQIVEIPTTVSYTNETVTLESGLSVMSDDSAEEAQTGEVRDQGVRYAVLFDGATDVSYPSGSDVVNVFLSVDLSLDDTIDVVTQDASDSAPPDPSLKIASIDTVNEESHVINAHPETRSRSTTTQSEVKLGEEITIPSGFTQLMDEFEVNGDVTVDGVLQTVAENPTPKRHDHRGNDLIPRTSSTDLSVESWESVTIKDGQGMTTPGPYRIEGEFTVNGEFLSFDEISGDTAIGGSGRVRVQ